MKFLLAKDAVDTAKKEKGVTQTELATLAGMTGQSTVSEYLKRDMKISVFVRLMDALGYDVVLHKRHGGRQTKEEENMIAIVDGLPKNTG